MFVVLGGLRSAGERRQIRACLGPAVPFAVADRGMRDHWTQVAWPGTVRVPRWALGWLSTDGALRQPGHAPRAEPKGDRGAWADAVRGRWANYVRPIALA